MIRRSGVAACAASHATAAPRPSSQHNTLRDHPPPELFRALLSRLQISRWSNYALLRPYISSNFTVEDGQYAALGTALVQRQVSKALFEYASYRNSVVVSSNVSRQLASCVSNHYSYRLVYDEQLPELVELKQKPFEVMLEDAAASSAGGGGSSCALLECLEPYSPGPSRQDTAGTAFEFLPHKFGQCPSGRALAHLIGAIQVDQGVTTAQRVVNTLWQLDDDPIFPRVAAKHLSALLQRYHLPNVCLAILAAQGHVVSFSSKTIMLPIPQRQQQYNSSTSGGAAAQRSNDDADHGVESSVDVEQKQAFAAAFNVGGTSEDVAQAKQHDVAVAPQTTAGPDHLFSVEAQRLARLQNSPVAGPGFFNAIDKWREQNALAPQESVEDGFLTAKERKPAAHRNTIDFTSFAFAGDKLGTPQPEQGKRVARSRFGAPPRDPSFYSAITEGGRQGIEVDTGGYSAAEYVKLFSAPHLRKFEVTMNVTSPFQRQVAVAVGDRYTTARYRCCERYVASLVHDINALGSWG